MSKRNIVMIDREKCDGCGQCVSACHEGAIQLVEGKAQLVSESYCDGLGACIGECPQGAITITEREAEAFDAAAVEQHLAQPKRKAKAPKAQDGKLPCGCPSAAVRELRPAKAKPAAAAAGAQPSELANWPVQLRLVPPNAPYLRGARLLIAADCVAFALPDFHSRLLAGKVLLIGCPKLDDVSEYREKLAEIFRVNDIASVDVAHMEVPCCFGLVHLVRQALADAGAEVPLRTVKVGIGGEVLSVA